MENIFANPKSHSVFTWGKLGDVQGGRGDLGEEMPVVVYRLMQFTMLDVLAKEFGAEKANGFIKAAGHLAGTEFARNALNTDLPFDEFVSHLQKTLQDFKIGVLRMEEFEGETGRIVLTVGQDLDCSGLPISDETVCDYDEGFISGILEIYTGKPYEVKEIDCWANGDRVCRFSGSVKAK